VASYKPNGERRDYWTYRQSAKLSVLGDVTLVLSKRRFNDPPRKIKLLVTNLPKASTGDILSHFARRWMGEVTFKELKTGLHLGQMQVTKKEERIQRSVALPVMAYLLLLRLYGWDLKPEQGASLFALKRRFIEEAYLRGAAQSDRGALQKETGAIQACSLKTGGAICRLSQRYSE
jgi:hypothetical protein